MHSASRSTLHPSSSAGLFPCGLSTRTINPDQVSRQTCALGRIGTPAPDAHTGTSGITQRCGTPAINTESANDTQAADGVTHFKLQFDRAAPPAAWQLNELQRWRTRMVNAGVVGQDARRYDGVGFGNLSARHPGRPAAFIITGTQTGACAVLGAHGFAVVTHVDLAHNRVVAHGGTAPSSEAMTHAVLYQADAAIEWVFHGHAPSLWRAAGRMHIASTPADVGYGTPAMALAVTAIRRRQPALPALIRMGGHEDGIIAFGHTADSTGQLFEDALARASEFTRRQISSAANPRRS